MADCIDCHRSPCRCFWGLAELGEVALIEQQLAAAQAEASDWKAKAVAERAHGDAHLVALGDAQNDLDAARADLARLAGAARVVVGAWQWVGVDFGPTLDGPIKALAAALSASPAVPVAVEPVAPVPCPGCVEHEAKAGRLKRALERVLPKGNGEAS